MFITLNRQEGWTGTQHYYGPASTRDRKECSDGPPHHNLHNNGGPPHLTIPQCVICDFQRWPQSVVEVPKVSFVLQHDYQEYVRSQWLWLSKKVKCGSRVLIFICDLLNRERIKGCRTNNSKGLQEGLTCNWDIAQRRRVRHNIKAVERI